MTSADGDALLQQAVENAEAILREAGSIAIAKLGPRAIRAEVARRLEARGFEVGKSRVERPAKARVQALLAEGAFLPVASLRARVPGLAPARAKTVAAELVASGEARVVLRTSKETLVPARARVLDASEIRALGRALSDLAKTCATASRKKAELLREDVDAALARARAAFDRPASVEDVIQEAADPKTGLAFVPRVVEALAPRSTAEVHAALLAASRAGRVELRPEGGLGRLTAAERDACVPGPEGALLSWARVVHRGAT